MNTEGMPEAEFAELLAAQQAFLDDSLSAPPAAKAVRRAQPLQAGFLNRPAPVAAPLTSRFAAARKPSSAPGDAHPLPSDPAAAPARPGLERLGFRALTVAEGEPGAVTHDPFALALAGPGIPAKERKPAGGFGALAGRRGAAAPPPAAREDKYGNAARVAGMSAAERAEEVAEATAALGADTVKFLRGRGRGKKGGAPGPAAAGPEAAERSGGDPRTAAELARSGGNPRTDAELAAAVSSLPPQERSKLDWTAPP
ncbi:hypothetical protein TeGR_g9887, partial [Tetraparma gracilis]